MTKQELEIRYKVLEERMERIYELCKKYTGISNGAETIGEIEANCDPDIIGPQDRICGALAER